MANRLRSAADLRAYRQNVRVAPGATPRVISLCTGSGCRLTGAERLAAAFDAAIEKEGLRATVQLRRTGCHGFREASPLVVVYPEGILYEKVRRHDVPEILGRTVRRGEEIERLLHRDPEGRTHARMRDIPFYKRQTRVVLALNGRVAPDSIEDYVEFGGYQALAKALIDMRPEQVLRAIYRSGLRSRSGGGFPVGIVWRSCREAPPGDGVRHIVCNAEGGGRGASIDCFLLEGNPHLMIEGMIIGAYAIGEPGQPIGHVYVPDEHHVAGERLRTAVKQARELGLLGSDILGTGFDFDITVHRGDTLPIRTESTATFASGERHVVEGRATHSHAQEPTLFRGRSCSSNAETWASVPVIIRRGAEWFSCIGTGDVTESPWRGSTGTKVVLLAGHVCHRGLIEVPMGTTLRHIIFDIGGGIPDGRRFKAVQTGGPSDGCLPESLLDTPLDFDRLLEAGGMMGAREMIVMDESTCMVDVARQFAHHLTDGSRDKGTTHRKALTEMCRILDRICEGQGQPEDLDLLLTLSGTVADASFGGLVRAAPNPLGSTLRYFRQEYEEHVQHRICRTRVCRALTHEAA